MSSAVSAPVRKLDPVKFEVIRNALVEATEEMGLALRRSAYSTNIKTRADFSCVIFDEQLRFLASGFAQPTHLGSMYRMVPMAVRDYGPENLGPGDAILVNDPYLGGVHLNDIAMISPVYHDGVLRGYVADIAHHVDVGGGAPASIGAFREVYQEGVIISPVKLMSGGEIVGDVFRLVLTQIRSKHETAGRLPRAGRGDQHRDPAARGAARPLRPRDGVVLHRRADRVHRAPDPRRASQSCRRASTAQRVRSTTTASRTIRCAWSRRSSIDDEGILFDFEGCDPQRRAPVNSTYCADLRRPAPTR